MSDEQIAKCPTFDKEIIVVPTARPARGGGVQAYCQGTVVSQTSVGCVLSDGQTYECKRAKNCPFFGTISIKRR